jgi:hypothetical protein
LKKKKKKKKNHLEKSSVLEVGIGKNGPAILGVEQIINLKKF